MKELEGIKALIEKDHKVVCKLSDYTCIEFGMDGKLLCGSVWCKDKLLNDVMAMGETND